MLINEYRIVDGKTVRIVVEADYSKDAPDWFKRQRMMGFIAQYMVANGDTDLLLNKDVKP